MKNLNEAKLCTFCKKFSPKFEKWNLNPGEKMYKNIQNSVTSHGKDHLATPRLICPVCTSLVCTLQVCYSCLSVCRSTPFSLPWSWSGCVHMWKTWNLWLCKKLFSKTSKILQIYILYYVKIFCYPPYPWFSYQIITLITFILPILQR